MSERVISQFLGEGPGEIDKNFSHRVSDGELEVVKQLILGESNKDISNKINVEISIISSHKGRLFSKQQVANAIELYELCRISNSKVELFL